MNGRPPVLDRSKGGSLRWIRVELLHLDQNLSAITGTYREIRPGLSLQGALRYPLQVRSAKGAEFGEQDFRSGRNGHGPRASG